MSPLMVVSEEVPELVGGLGQYVAVGQIDDAEMIRLFPMETAAVGQQDVLLPQQVKGELLVVHHAKALLVQLGEDVKGGLGPDKGQAGDGLQCVADALPLLVNAAAGHQQLFGGVQARHGRRDQRLGGHVGAQPHGGEQVQPLNVVLRPGLVAADAHPAAAVAAHQMGFG